MQTHQIYCQSRKKDFCNVSSRELFLELECIFQSKIYPCLRKKNLYLRMPFFLLIKSREEKKPKDLQIISLLLKKINDQINLLVFNQNYLCRENDLKTMDFFLIGLMQIMMFNLEVSFDKSVRFRTFDFEIRWC